MAAILIIGAIMVPILFYGSYLGAKRAINKKNWRIRLDQTSEEIIIESASNQSGKAEFIEEPDQQTIEELEQDPAWRKFLNKFKKTS